MSGKNRPKAKSMVEAAPSGTLAVMDDCWEDDAVDVNDPKGKSNARSDSNCDSVDDPKAILQAELDRLEHEIKQAEAKTDKIAEKARRGFLGLTATI